VVIYRVPAGLSLVRPGSHCPKCKHPIRWRDNIPILGWIALGGRCRDCRAEISPRYPLVEAITAAMFLALGIVETFSGGANLPLRPGAAGEGALGLLDVTQSAAVTAYHLVLLCTLLAAAWIEYDGHPLPWRLALPAWVVGGLAPLVWPWLRPVPAVGGLEGPIAGLVDGLAGIAIGSLVGLAFWPVVGKRRGLGLLLSAGCTGLLLGWQAAGVLALAAGGLPLVFSPLERRWPFLTRIAPTAWLAPLALLWILAWRPLAACWP